MFTVDRVGFFNRMLIRRAARRRLGVWLLGYRWNSLAGSWRFRHLGQEVVHGLGKKDDDDSSDERRLSCSTSTNPSASSNHLDSLLQRLRPRSPARTYRPPDNSNPITSTSPAAPVSLTPLPSSLVVYSRTPSPSCLTCTTPSRSRGSNPRAGIWRSGCGIGIPTPSPWGASSWWRC